MSRDMTHCSICGYPIMQAGCLHVVLGLTADEWRERNKIGNKTTKIKQGGIYLEPVGSHNTNPFNKQDNENKPHNERIT